MYKPFPRGFPGNQQIDGRQYEEMARTLAQTQEGMPAQGMGGPINQLNPASAQSDQTEEISRFLATPPPTMDSSPETIAHLLGVYIRRKTSPKIGSSGGSRMIIGIDPGLGGAIAAIHDDQVLALDDMPTMAPANGAVGIGNEQPE